MWKNFDRESLQSERLIEEQCGFRSGKGCVDQVFVMKQESEKFVDKSLYVAGLIERQCELPWACMEKRLSCKKWCKVCMKRVGHVSRVCRQESEWLEVGVRLKQGCVMSPFSLKVVRESR